MINIYEAPDAYMCRNCGQILEMKDTNLSYDDVLQCKCCGSEDLVEAYTCEVCGELKPEDFIYAGDHKVCRHCLEKKRFDLDFCTKVGSVEFTECKLNSFLADHFTESEINELMLVALKERAKFDPIDGFDYLDYQHAAAADMLYEEERG